MLEYFMEFLDEVFSPKMNPLEIIIEYRDSSALKCSCHRLNVIALLTGEGKSYLILSVHNHHSKSTNFKPPYNALVLYVASGGTSGSMREIRRGTSSCTVSHTISRLMSKYA